MLTAASACSLRNDTFRAPKDSAAVGYRPTWRGSLGFFGSPRLKADVTRAALPLRGKLLSRLLAVVSASLKSDYPIQILSVLDNTIYFG